MKTLTAAVVIGSLFIGPVAHAGVVAERQARQGARIDQGVASGALTAGETQRLERQQGVIARTHTRALSDGVMTAPEARHLTREQDRASSDIYRLKHNARTW
jgi:hypothetical protein